MQNWSSMFCRTSPGRGRPTLAGSTEAQQGPVIFVAPWLSTHLHKPFCMTYITFGNFLPFSKLVRPTLVWGMVTWASQDCSLWSSWNLFLDLETCSFICPVMPLLDQWVTCSPVKWTPKEKPRALPCNNSWSTKPVSKHTSSILPPSLPKSCTEGTVWLKLTLALFRKTTYLISPLCRWGTQAGPTL